MSPLAHNLYRGTLISIFLIVSILVGWLGYSYYTTPIVDRFYHPQHDLFKPSGIMGHGLGILGTLMMLIGVTLYILRKRKKFMSRWGRLKYWLEFHIFLCSLGPVLILYHTAFKFGGIVSIAFWSMVAVVLSGIIGRYIYIQIPRSIEGRELTIQELSEKRTQLNRAWTEDSQVHLDQHLKDKLLEMMSNHTIHKNGIKQYLSDRNFAKSVQKKWVESGLNGSQARILTRKLREELRIKRRIENLHLMQKLFKYWHVIHLPFAIIMLLIVLLHTGVTLAFGYKWIF